MLYGLNPSTGKTLFSSPNDPEWLWGPPSLLFNGYQNSFLGVKQAGHDVDHSPPSNTAVQNECSYSSAPPLCLHVMERDN
jgi:hypothetical protein